MQTSKILVSSNSGHDADRTVGFEIEYADVPLEVASAEIRRLFGGHVEKITTAEWTVTDTNIGTFKLEIDANPIKTWARSVNPEAEANSDNVSEIRRFANSVTDQAIDAIGPKVAPLEIVAPPISIADIEKLDELRAALFTLDAEGTRGSLFNAFGLHINAEAPSMEPTNILQHIQAFAVLYPLLLDLHSVDVTRRISPYIEPYSEEYLAHILADDYAPSLHQLIKDYHAYNPSRDRALDMLPLFAYLAPNLVRGLYGSEEKINARPTYHYRLPNSEVGNENWSLMAEWRRWCLVEKVARSADCLADLRALHRTKDDSFNIAVLFEAKVDQVKAIKNLLEVHNVAY